ncbi:hypothetical protein GFS31_16380 [Leptolyngbya sp. BL0902]|nr:hypothetical protein GFS31_16380 [Leptolyngbya sp. BL0902]
MVQRQANWNGWISPAPPRTDQWLGSVAALLLPPSILECSLVHGGC